MRSRPPDNAPNAPRRRSWFRVGPGLILAIVASVVVWQMQGRGRIPAPPAAGPPRIERTVQGVSSENLPESERSAPDPAWLLEPQQTKALSLTRAQEQWLSARRNRWDRETTELRSSLEQAVSDYHQRLREKGRGLSVSEIQELAAPVSLLSRQLADARRAWWAEASQPLTEEQRQKAETMWARRLMSSVNTKEAN